MTVIDDEIVHTFEEKEVEEVQELEGDHSLNHCALSHVYYLICHKQSQDRLENRNSNTSNWRKHSFSVIIPRKLPKHSDIDLRLMLVSLKNIKVAVSVHIQKIERELKKRGSKLTIVA
ncbi:MAG: hypothetical protein RTU63_03020 [Candidatus Thorarchaeota archaeon]